jgi:hypothetical protein
MGFLWFGKKKSKKIEEAPREIVEVFNVDNFVLVTHPLGNSAGTALSTEVICSSIFSVIANEDSVASKAVQDFLQERGAMPLTSSEYTHSSSQGYAARVKHQDSDKSSTVLIGPPAVISKASVPFHPEINDAIAASQEIFIVAIDGITYAAFTISSEMK